MKALFLTKLFCQLYKLTLIIVIPDEQIAIFHTYI